MVRTHSDKTAGVAPPGQELSKTWSVMARAQGLVCMVCYAVPSLERREAFYDTGLCAACAASAERAASPARGG